MYADILKKIVNNYEYYKNIAVNLECVEFSSKFYDWYEYPVGAYVTICNFPNGYIKNNFEQAYVQTILRYMYYMDRRRNKDLQDITPAELPEDMAKNKYVYEQYITYHELRMNHITEDYLIQKIKSYTEYNDIPKSEINSVIPYLTGAEIIEIGGDCPEEYSFISIKDNSIMLIDCGLWD
ncbi:MAG: hypothetical protein HDT23_01285 [Ruminococcus sp.]|nr:hypothetical protein [Ruminococcus sp.]